MQHRSEITEAARLSVAPMMDWTDRHCRYFHRLLTKKALLYTEMVTAPAILHGDRAKLLGFDPCEQPVAVQLGGSDPAELAEAARVATDFGYGEINLNCGCPSDRVQSGAFGAVLMKDAERVARCVEAMQGVTSAEVTVKCRIGVDEQTPEEILPVFLQKMQEAGVTRITIHARKAWLQGLSPKENRTIPPLNYPLVYDMVSAFPGLHISLNGGVESLAQAKLHLACGPQGVMIGRAAYHQPYDLLARADAEIFGDAREAPTAIEVAREMEPYIAHHLESGRKLNQITRHMLGLFHGQPGARGWKRALSGMPPDSGLERYKEALEQISASHIIDFN